ncbi:hypothetical protein [uncultured Rubinisphaera sp.]|uniref:hypothetical protein n=1 Tax=uncultured Rubinisphaera sp. TaxID=1678686 RepID=UPI000EE2BB94|nr:hypothetical protein [Planctomycetaceae bacterium]|tara:strand:- start:3368 stop:3931 length:564 start_codon:yes stop_codon:yes gene_type:complete
MTEYKPVQLEPRRKSWRVRIGSLTLFLLAIVIVARTIDYFWYQSQIPTTFQNTKWRGTWETEKYGLTGRLLVRLPDPLPENEDFDAEAMVYYPAYSIYRTGSFMKMDFVGNFSPDSAASTGETKSDEITPEGLDIMPKGGGKLKFRAIAGNQIVEYVALINEDQTRVNGGYISTMPNDYGYFIIEKQ